MAAGLSLTQTQEQIEEEGEDAGLSSSEIARLQEEAAECGMILTLQHLDLTWHRVV